MVDAQEAESVARALQHTLGPLQRRLRRVKVDNGLTMPEIAALAQLDRGGPATSTELARREQMSPQSMGATLAALHGKGMVERHADPNDRRRVIFSIDEAGSTALRDKRNARIEQMTRILATDFTAVELDTMAVAAPLLQRLTRAL